MAAKRNPRRYSDEERAEALAALVANGGNVNKTAQQLDIPEATLRQWNNGERHPEAAQMSEQKRPPLADRLDAITHKLIDVADKKADQLNAKDAMIAAAVAIDKSRLLRGEATTINEHRGTLTARIDHLAAAFAGAADREEAGAVPGDGPGEPVPPGGGA